MGLFYVLRIGIIFCCAISFISRRCLCLILYNVNMLVFSVWLHLLLSYVTLCFVKILFNFFYLHLPQIFT